MNHPKSIETLTKALARFDKGDLAKKISELAEKPEAQKFQFFSQPHYPEDYYPSTSIFEVLVQQHKKLFVYSDNVNQGLRGITIPPNLLYELSKLLFGECATRPEPVLGYDQHEKMDDPNSRILAIPCPGDGMPGRVHTLISTNRGGAYQHDTLHVFYDSVNPHREGWCDLASRFSNTSLGSPFDDRAFERYFSVFEPKPHNPLSLVIQEIEEKIGWTRGCEFWDVLLDLVSSSREYSQCQADVFKYILDKGREWGPKYDISYASLEKHFEIKYIGSDYQSVLNRFLKENELEKFKPINPVAAKIRAKDEFRKLYPEYCQKFA